jgi:hypothetical protein
MSPQKIPSSVNFNFFIEDVLKNIRQSPRELVFTFASGSTITMPVPESYTVKNALTAKAAEEPLSATVKDDGSVSWNQPEWAKNPEWRKFVDGGLVKERAEPFPGDFWKSLTGDVYTIVSLGRLQSTGERTVTYRKTAPHYDGENWTATMSYFMAKVHTVDSRGWATDIRADRFTRVMP